MNLRQTIRCCATAAFLVPSLSVVAQTLRHNVPYTTDASGSYSGDLYEPAGVGPFPAIVYVHGGSWRSGGKKDFARLAEDLAARGYVGFSIDYDLHPHSWPHSLEESNAAVRFLREHAAEYHIDPERVFVAGTSAGGELAALVALEQKNRIEGAIMLNSVYDLTGNYGVIHRYLGGHCAEIGDVCEEASPMSRIHAGAPAFFVGHGTSDHTVPFASAELFTAEMKKAGNSVTFLPARKGPHTYWQKKAYYSETLAAIEAFLALQPS